MAAKTTYRGSTYQAPPNDGVIVDLSEFAERIVAYEDIAQHLSQEQEMKIVDYVKSMVDMSYNKIKSRYSYWKEADRAHDVYVPSVRRRLSQTPELLQTLFLHILWLHWADVTRCSSLRALTGKVGTLRSYLSASSINRCVERQERLD